MGNPTVTPLVERRHDGGYIVWEPSNGIVTRKAALLLSGAGVCMAGLVLGSVLTGATAAASAMGTNTGNPTFGTITVTSEAMLGDYILSFTSATRFKIENPEGEQIGQGVLATPFDAGGLSFTGAAGGTPAAAGDTWKIKVTGGVRKYVPFDPTADTGAEIVAGILYGWRDATSADQECVVNHQGPMRINAAELIWGANVTTNQHKLDALAALTALPGGGIQAS